MMKLLLGGSPCTRWSIARTRNRETGPEGLGWELFENYRIALEKFRPRYFLYENNKSMLGNGWTVDVIAHILGFAPGIAGEPLEVLSMYDGMGGGLAVWENNGKSWLAYRRRPEEV